MLTRPRSRLSYSGGLHSSSSIPRLSRLSQTSPNWAKLQKKLYLVQNDEVFGGVQAGLGFDVTRGERVIVKAPKYPRGFEVDEFFNGDADGLQSFVNAIQRDINATLELQQSLVFHFTGATGGGKTYLMRHLFDRVVHHLCLHEPVCSLVDSFSLTATQTFGRFTGSTRAQAEDQTRDLLSNLQNRLNTRGVRIQPGQPAQAITCHLQGQSNKAEIIKRALDNAHRALDRVETHSTKLHGRSTSAYVVMDLGIRLVNHPGRVLHLCFIDTPGSGTNFIGTQGVAQPNGAGTREGDLERWIRERGKKLRDTIFGANTSFQELNTHCTQSDVGRRLQEVLSQTPTMVNIACFTKGICPSEGLDILEPVIKANLLSKMPIRPRQSLVFTGTQSKLPRPSIGSTSSRTAAAATPAQVLPAQEKVEPFTFDPKSPNGKEAEEAGNVAAAPNEITMVTESIIASGKRFADHAKPGDEGGVASELIQLMPNDGDDEATAAQETIVASDTPSASQVFPADVGSGNQQGIPRKKKNKRPSGLYQHVGGAN